MSKALKEFVEFCKTASANEIYEKLEYNTNSNLRDEIYALADPVSDEPFRSAMFNLGFVNY